MTVIHFLCQEKPVDWWLGVIYYSCVWPPCSSPLHWPFSLWQGWCDSQITTVYLTQIPQGYPLSTRLKRRTKSQDNYMLTLQAEVQTQACRFLVRHANHCATDTWILHEYCGDYIHWAGLGKLRVNFLFLKMVNSHLPWLLNNDSQGVATPRNHFILYFNVTQIVSLLMKEVFRHPITVFWPRTRKVSFTMSMFNCWLKTNLIWNLKEKDGNIKFSDLCTN